MSEFGKNVEYDNIYYSINKKEKTASVIYSSILDCYLIIPRSIKHKSKEYLITSISESAFYKSFIKSVDRKKSFL